MALQKELRKLRGRISDRIKAESLRLFDDVLCVRFPDSKHMNASRLCLLAHYSLDGSVADYVLNYVLALKRAGCDVVLISSAANVPDRDINAVLGFGAAVILRKNIGYDFGSWRTALRVLPDVRARYDSVVFANDSVYGPFSDLREVFDEMEGRHLDVWSLTCSLEIKPHLQTYFWVLTREGLKGRFFEYFWFSHYRYYSNRKTVIQQYELKIREMAEMQFGLSIGTYVDIEELYIHFRPKCAMEKCNPVHHLALCLVQEMGFPFVKRELLESDPLKLSIFKEIDRYLSSRKLDEWKLAKKHMDSARA